MSTLLPLTPLPSDYFTPYRIIRMAAQDAGLLRRGGELDSEQLVDYMGRLNEVLLFTQTQGLKLWLQALVTVPLVAGQQTYTIGPGGNVVINKPTRIIEGYYLDSTGNQRPLMPLSWDDWNKLSNKTQPGQINSYFVDKQSVLLNLSFWLTPDEVAVTGTAQMQTQQQQPTVVALTDTMIFPPEWGIYMHWALAAQICVGAPQSVKQYVAAMSQSTMERLENWDVEDASTRFQPDIRGIQQFGSNRG